MNKSIAMKWIKALRGGTYKQGKGRLRAIDEDEFVYCCLGVLCEIQKSFPGTVMGGLSASQLVEFEFNSSSGFIDIPTRPKGISKYEKTTLARLNDNAGHSNA